MAQKTRRRKAYRPRAATAPILSCYDPIALVEHQCVCAFEGGYAGRDHWNALADCRLVLALGITEKSKTAKRFGGQAAIDEINGLVGVTRLAETALSNIREVEREAGRFDPSDEECRALALLVTTSADFWARQTRDSYRRAIAAADDRLQVKQPQTT